VPILHSDTSSVVVDDRPRDLLATEKAQYLWKCVQSAAQQKFNTMLRNQQRDRKIVAAQRPTPHDFQTLGRDAAIARGVQAPA
jgi:hypothetical protein